MNGRGNRARASFLARVGIALAAFVALGLVVTVLPIFLVNVDVGGRVTELDASELADARNSVRTTLLQAVGGLVLTAGVVATWQTVRINREGQITERFTRAIDQLGDAKLDVRLGGIYGLERIARDSLTDHGPVMEVLTAFVREHAARGDDHDAHGRRADGDANESRAARPAPRTDIQAAISVIGRRNASHDAPDQILALSGVDLTQAVLKRANFSRANFSRADFSRANLSRANLSDAHLGGANLSDAHLGGADLSGAHLGRANLSHAFLSNADLTGAYLRDANLSHAFLPDADLTGAYLRDANLGGANLSGANLRGAILRGAILSDADLRDADLSGTDLTNVDLTNVDLTNVDLTNVRGYAEK